MDSFYPVRNDLEGGRGRERREERCRRDEQGGKILGLVDYCQVEREEGEGGGKEDITLKEWEWGWGGEAGADRQDEVGRELQHWKGNSGRREPRKRRVRESWRSLTEKGQGKSDAPGSSKWGEDHKEVRLRLRAGVRGRRVWDRHENDLCIPHSAWPSARPRPGVH